MWKVQWVSRNGGLTYLCSLRLGLIDQTGKYTKHCFIHFGHFGNFQFKSSYLSRFWWYTIFIHTLNPYYAHNCAGTTLPESLPGFIKKVNKVSLLLKVCILI